MQIEISSIIQLNTFTMQVASRVSYFVDGYDVRPTRGVNRLCCARAPGTVIYNNNITIILILYTMYDYCYCRYCYYYARVVHVPRNNAMPCGRRLRHTRSGRWSPPLVGAQPLWKTGSRQASRSNSERGRLG